MKTPKVIRFRCYCIECSDDGSAMERVPQAAVAEPDRDQIEKEQSNPHSTADSIEKVLFGA
ncbi:hypothetical protein [Rhizobium sp. P44RR-XXIV]|uniref:hypothetical protein n=1 Tax=Rhizobium sp. P44RR-XXIV TaxID=1921145 RepID=UPI0009860B84|nr:hypothetical protein [Rhizobium sp. P44RR-XXIV]TIX88847.1 hypothetical protein BSK43_019555 [Rhizobium sp. P44RR-XXIV]